MSAWWRDRVELVRLFLGAGRRARAVLVMSLLVAVVPSMTALVTGWLVSRVARVVDRSEVSLAQVALPLVVLGVILVAGRRRATDLAWKRPVWAERRQLLSHQWITIGTAGLTALFALAVLGWAKCARADRTGAVGDLFGCGLRGRPAGADGLRDL